MTMLFWLFAVYGWVLAIIFCVAYVISYRALQRAWHREDGYLQMIADHVPELRPSLAALKAARIAAPLLLILALPATSSAQTSAIIAGNLADAVSTEYVIAHAHAREGNPIMGATTTQRVIMKTIGTGVQVWLIRKLEPRHPTLAKGLGYGLGIAFTSVAIHNLRVMR